MNDLCECRNVHAVMCMLTGGVQICVFVCVCAQIRDVVLPHRANMETPTHPRHLPILAATTQVKEHVVALELAPIAPVEAGVRQDHGRRCTIRPMARLDVEQCDGLARKLVGFSRLGDIQQCWQRYEMSKLATARGGEMAYSDHSGSNYTFGGDPKEMEDWGDTVSSVGGELREEAEGTAARRRGSGQEVKLDLTARIVEIEEENMNLKVANEKLKDSAGAGANATGKDGKQEECDASSSPPMPPLVAWDAAGRVVGYTLGLTFSGHTVATSEDVMQALVTESLSMSSSPGRVIVPSSNASLLRWCLSGCGDGEHSGGSSSSRSRTLKQMLLMVKGSYPASLDGQGSYILSSDC